MIQTRQGLPWRISVPGTGYLFSWRRSLIPNSQKSRFRIRGIDTQFAQESKEELSDSESKKIVLEEDPSLPQATKVCSDVQDCMFGCILTVTGKNYTTRSSSWKESLCIWLGTSFEGSEGHYHRCRQRWYWLSTICSLGSCGVSFVAAF